MNKRTSFKLLSKITAVYLVFIFIAFFISTLFLTKETDRFIANELELRFRLMEHRIEMYKNHLMKNHSTRNHVTPLDRKPDLDRYPTYTDTLIYDPATEEMRRYRKKTSISEMNGQYYRLVLTLPVDDFYRLKEDIFRTLIPAFILLAVGIVGFNYLLSGYLIRPFNRILDQMKTYNMGQKSSMKEVKTNTHEFVRMQALFHNMVKRIENDYRNIKEYTENMAHELQTPLTVIRNKAEILMADDDVMQRHAPAVKIIDDEIGHLSRLGNTLNLLTKIENGEFNNTAWLETKPVIMKHLETVQDLMTLKSLVVETDLSEDHRLLIDPFLLDIVLKNLFRNAIHYGTGDGPIRVVTTADALSVSNYSHPVEVPIERLFDRFYRYRSQTSLGLGLALVKKICELNHLNVDCRYEDGQFVVRLISHP